MYSRLAPGENEKNEEITPEETLQRGQHQPTG